MLLAELVTSAVCVRLMPYGPPVHGGVFGTAEAQLRTDTVPIEFGKVRTLPTWKTPPAVVVRTEEEAVTTTEADVPAMGAAPAST